MAALVATNTWWLLLPAWALAGLAVSGLFILGHDASHGALFESKPLNRRVARLLMVPSLHVEAAWDLGHNRIHHGYTTREGFDFVWHPLTAAEYQALTPLRRLRHRAEWSFLGAGLYYVREVWWNKMMRFAGPDRHREAFRNGKVYVAIGGAALAIPFATIGWWQAGVLGALWAVVKLVVIPAMLFMQIIGWTVHLHHVAPDIRWWKRRDWTQFKGQMESTTIIELPRLLNVLFFHNIFVHVPHHVDVRIPFHQLPRAARAISEAFPGTVRWTTYRLREYVAGTRDCKLYDFDAGTWLPYRAATSPTARAQA
jgi:omega-6 fatty acid desaturase (delta-12 desaturase)